MPKFLIPPIEENDLYQYRALGVVRGRYYPSAEDFNIGTLVTNSAVIKAVINLKPNRPAKITSNIIENELLFSVYPKTKPESEGVVILSLRRHRKENIDVDSYFSIRGKLLAINDESFFVRIHRNWALDNFFDIVIKGTLPSNHLNKFCDLECVLSGEFLQLVNGQVVGEAPIVKSRTPDEPNPSPPKLADSQVVKQPDALSKAKGQVQVAQLPSVELKANTELITEQINVSKQKVTTVKSEITLKFNALPAAEPAPHKKVKLILADQNENRFIVLLNSKSYKKATEGAATYDKYAGNISGKLGKLTTDGFEVLDAGIKIFEVKSNPVNEAESNTTQQSQ